MDISHSKYHRELLEQCLTQIPECYRKDYLNRLENNPQESSGILAEIRTFIFFEKEFNCQVREINKSTHKKKDVDLSIECSNSIIDIEVSTAEEVLQGLVRDPRDVVDRIVRKKIAKFTRSQPNILVLCDEDCQNGANFNHAFLDEDYPSIMWNGIDLQGNRPIFLRELAKITALIIFNPSGHLDDFWSFSFHANPHCVYKLPILLLDKLNELKIK